MESRNDSAVLEVGAHRCAADWMDGTRAILPMLLGVIPFALVTGVTTVGVGIPPLTALSMAAIVFAGAAHLAAVQLFGDEAPLLVIVLTGFVVNLRFLMYSASIAPFLRRVSFRGRLLATYLLTDQAFLISHRWFSERVLRGGEEEEKDRAKRGYSYYLGAGFGLWFTWVLGNAAGIFLGASIPDSWSLDFALPLVFLVLLIPTLKNRASVLTALSSGAASVIFVGLPLRLGLIAAVVSGLFVGAIFQRRRSG